MLAPVLLPRGAVPPPLALLPAAAFSPAVVAAAKCDYGAGIHLAFPVKDEQETANLQALLARLAPYQGALFDAVWLACGAPEPGSLRALGQYFPWVRLLPVPAHLPPDQVGQPLGKGAAMRALLAYLIRSGAVRESRAIIYFCDADLQPAYFHPGWLSGPLGSLLWYNGVAAAKVVYFRPQGGRLNAILRGLLAALPCPELRPLQRLVYLLSGEMAATLKFWAAVPFKSGYGVEIFLLAALALGLVPAAGGLEQVVQVYVGEMDHRHSPLTTTWQQLGLDHMAAGVGAALLEALEAAGRLSWATPGPAGPLWCPLPTTMEPFGLAWRSCPVGEATFPPLLADPEIAALLE